MNGRPQINAILAATGILAGFLLLASCSDDLTEATALRAAFVRKDVIIRDTTLTPTSTSTFRTRLGMNGRLNQLGHSGGYQAYTLLQFLSAYFQQRDTVSVVSARLTLRLEGWFGDSTGTLAFTVHKISQDWRAPTVRWDSLPAFDATVRGTYSGVVTADTQQITIDLDTAMVREWLNKSTITQHGIILVPTPACNTIRGVHIFEFDSLKYYPTLEIIARNAAGTVQDTAKYDAGVDTFVGNVDDPVPSTERLFAQSGVVYRGRLRFDVSFIPRGSIINTAELTLVRDPATSRLNRFTPDSLLLMGTLVSATDSSRVDGTIAGGKISGASADTVKFDVRRPVQLWLVGNNNGLLLRTSALNELSSFSLFSFYNEQALQSAARPKMRIRYAVEREVSTR
jgi:hypothetical protein